MFSFCGLNRGSIRPGAAHHLAIKFDICDAELPDVMSDARQACGECVVRLPLTDFVSSNSLHFRELLIHNGLPVTDTGLEEDADTGECVPTKVYADFKIHLVGDGGFHHDMYRAEREIAKPPGGEFSRRAPSSPSMGPQSSPGLGGPERSSGHSSSGGHGHSRSNSLERYQERMTARTVKLLNKLPANCFWLMWSDLMLVVWVDVATDGNTLSIVSRFRLQRWAGLSRAIWRPRSIARSH
jgi:hypothetical protein